MQTVLLVSLVGPHCSDSFLYQLLENQVEVRQREVVELQSHVKALGQEVKDTDEVDGRRQVVEKKFQELLDPLRRRRNFLVASREVHQFIRDIEDEIVRRATLHTYTPPPHNIIPSQHQVFLAALGSGEDACGHIFRLRPQPADGSTADQEEPGELFFR